MNYSAQLVWEAWEVCLFMLLKTPLLNYYFVSFTVTLLKSVTHIITEAHFSVSHTT